MNTLKPPAETNDRERVYHFASIHKIGSILTSGLLPAGEKGGGDLWAHVNQLVDDQRPRSIARRGISRNGSVYAHPDLDNIQDPNAMGVFRGRGDEDPTVAISVDVARPDDALVADAHYLTPVYLKAKDGDMRDAKHFAKQYWKGAITLNDYRQFYTSTYERVGDEFVESHVRNENAPSSLPEKFALPEVLVPGQVDPSNLEWVAAHVPNQPAENNAAQTAA